MKFEKVTRPERVIQFGEGGFLRGFVDWMIQKMNDNGSFSGNAVVVQPIEAGMCDMLTAQNCCYTHVIRGVEGANGPGRLTKLMDITREQNGIILSPENGLWIEDGGEGFEYTTAPRVGIDYAEKRDREIHWRFILK